MNTTSTTTIKIDSKLKSEARALADELGMSFGTLVKVLLKQAVRKKGLTIDTVEERFSPEDMTPKMTKIIAEIERQRRAGTLETISHEEFMKELDAMIHEDK